MTREQGLDTFISSEIYVCQSALIEEALVQKLFSTDEIYNLYRPFDGRLIAPNVCYSCKSEFHFLDSETGKCEGCYEASNEPQEILEWWLVSSWLGRKLMIEGEPVLESSYGIWWGRTTSGQTVSADFIINKIYEDVMSYTG